MATQLKLTNFLLGLTAFLLVVISVAMAAIVTQLRVSPAAVLGEVVTVRGEVQEIAKAQAEVRLVQDVLRGSGSAVVGMDSQGLITLWSIGAEELFGPKSDDVIGQPGHFLIPTEMREAHNMAFATRMNSEELRPFQQTITCDAIGKDGKAVPVKINVWGIPNSSAIAIFTRQSIVNKPAAF